MAGPLEKKDGREKPMRTQPKTKRMNRRQQKQVELLLSAIPSILIGVNQKGFVTHWNAAAETTFGIPASDALDRPLAGCAIEWDYAGVSRGIQECRKKGSLLRLNDISYRRTSGEEGFLGFTIIPLKQEATGIAERLLFGADVTERRRTEQLKNEFVSVVSHELRSPLTVIKEGISQILDGILGGINAEQRRFLTISIQGIDRLTRIVDDLLDISRIETGRLELRRESVDVIRLVKGVILTFRTQLKKKGIAAETLFSNERIVIHADKDRLIQVFTNLIDNALKFTEKGKIEIGVVDKGDSVECSVQDTGRGIAAADLPRVFGKFQQFGRPVEPVRKGTGLGLAICKGIVESHKGRIWVESRFGEGTRFIFTLPKSTEKALPREHPSNQQEELKKHGEENSYRR